MTDKKPGGSIRIQRVEKELKDLISSFMVMQLGSEMDGIAAITRVIVSKDLRNARVLVYNQGGLELAKQNADVLQAHAHPINQYINTQVRMKYSPKLKFYVDDKFEDAMKVQMELRRLELERLESEEKSQSEDE